MAVVRQNLIRAEIRQLRSLQHNGITLEALLSGSRDQDPVRRQPLNRPPLFDGAQGTISELPHGLTQLDHNGDASHQVVYEK